MGGAGARLLALNHIQLAMPPDEEEEALRFYGSTLGLTDIPKPAELAPRDGDLEVQLGIEEPFSSARKAHPAFLVHDLDTRREKIEAAGYRVTDDVPLEGFNRCHVRDPFGNRLELVEPV